MKYFCTGRVQPERTATWFDQVLVEFTDDMKAIVSCTASQIAVVLDVPWKNDPLRAQIWANEAAWIVVGALGFSQGHGYSVEIAQVTEQDGKSHVFGVAPDRTLQIGTDHNPAYNRALQLSAKNVVFRRALRDYLRAITDEIDCEFYCYRAIEAIKSAFPGEKDQQWNAMHSALGTDKATIEKTVKNYADPVRHGTWDDAKKMNRLQRWEMQSLTRDILVKYMDYVS